MTNNQLVAKLKSDGVKARFQEVLGEKANGFVASMLSVVGNNNLLSKASFDTVYTSAMKAATLDLPIEPSLGFAYIVPYKGAAQFQIGYKGLIQLAQRSGQIQKLNAGEIYESQFKSYNPLTEDLEVDAFAMPEKGDKVVGYFAYMRLVNGFEKTVFWSKERVEEHGKKYSQSYGSKFSPWKTDFDAMARKTVLKQMLSTYAPLSVEMQDAIVADNADSTVNAEPKDVTPEKEAEADIMDFIGDGEPRDVTPADEVPAVDPETGEVVEDIKLFENLGDLME